MKVQQYFTHNEFDLCHCESIAGTNSGASAEWHERERIAFGFFFWAEAIRIVDLWVWMVFGVVVY